MRAPGAVAAVLLVLSAPAAAQARWSGGPALHAAHPVGTMGDYLGDALGLALVLHPPVGVLGRLEAGYLSFAARTVSRPYGGKGATPVEITSSARVVMVALGPELAMQWLGAEWTVGVHGGAGHVQATGSTVLPGDPDQVQRANSYATLTWAAGARAGIARRFGSARLGVEVGFEQLGRTKFLREYNLPVGVISGIYLNPSPYAPAFLTAGATLRVPL